ncbi:polysaccharide biosynthesis tyrosine autokinase [Fulvivirgaceae bacterium BMA10]|uniref:non-specific protein-tyrosine kinase n=1 Tax=Splendidivirga corallicola TaxID=3051826 RepID=A0ABT8KSY6_9BACT|nr:polysaccharide biosynthesis tyrosine autokinase [Fulvivirgaceae bacterium BMA10]
MINRFYDIEPNGEMDQEESSNPFDIIDFDKVRSVLRRSIPWIILICIATNTTAYLFLRWTPELFESYSELKLEVKNEASLFGFNSFNDKGNQNFNTISGEIELLKSRLFLEKVIEVVELDISYYFYGNILVNERYKNSPFKVDYALKSNSVLDIPFDIEITNSRSFRLTYSLGGNEISDVYNFDEKIDTDYFTFKISLTRFYEENVANGKYYFTINSSRALNHYLSSNLDVTPINFQANTIRISFSDHNKYKARDLVNAIDTIYLNYTQEEKTKENKQKIDFINEQIKQTREKLEADENFFESFAIENQTTNVDEDLRRTLTYKRALDSQRLAIKQRIVKLDQITSKIDELDTIISTSEMPLIDIPTDIKATLNELNQLLIDKNRVLSTYNENTSAYRRIRKQVDFLKQKAINLIRNYKNEYNEELDRITNRIIDLERMFRQLPSKGTEFSKRQRAFSLQEQNYLELLQKKTEFEIAEAGTKPDFVILSSASLPHQSIYPNRWIIYGIGAVAGLILSLIFVGIRYLMHNTISSQHELEKLTPAPILGIVPFYKEAEMPENNLVIDKNPKAGISEAFRSIRTNMQFLKAGKNKKVICVTSTISNEGKTFVSVNLGAIIALSNQKVILVDMDMRNPNIHGAFSQENINKGVSTILISKNTVQECIRRTSIENLDFMAAGPKPPNPAELILGEAFDQFLEELKASYDVVILDTPPVGLVTDGVLMMKKSDLPIYVLRADYSRKSFVNNINRLVKVNKFKNISIILNSFRSSRNQAYGYGYGYGYSYKYNYGDGYYGETVKKKLLDSRLFNLFSKK